MITDLQYETLKQEFLTLIEELKALHISPDKAAELSKDFIRTTLIAGVKVD